MRFEDELNLEMGCLENINASEAQVYYIYYSDYE